MWTPRRLVLFVGGIALFTAVYLVYAGIFGRIDGLPTLPAAFLVRRDPDADVLVPARDVAIDGKLQRAFGANCIETSFNHKIELQKNGVILATNDVRIDAQGRCRFVPFSIAVVKERGANEDPEIYTIHSDEGYLIFDEPAKNLTEIGKRRIVGCELISDPSLLSPDPRCHRITCVHNRASTDPEDDIVMETTGPVAYRELPGGETKEPHIQTQSAVKLTDKRGAPRSTLVTAQGMKIYLLTTAPAPTAKKGQPKSPTVSGVQKIVLPETVAMDIWIDPKSGFLSGGKAAESEHAERTNVQISTPGAFTYEIGQDSDRARFEMRQAAAENDRPAFVQVVRPLTKGDVTTYDRLDCETLELEFAHKSDPAGASSKSELGANLKSVHAWGQYVVLTSQAENMQANCKDLFHDALTKQTTLKGLPEVVALKDSHEVHAPEVVLVHSAGKGAGEAHAKGPGFFKGHLAGGQGDKDRPRTFTAVWRDKMSYVKTDGEDIITLIGSAAFQDPDRKQSLAGEQIKLSLAPDQSAARSNDGERKLKPRRLEVTGRVAADAEELKIIDTEQLVVLFPDAPAPSKTIATPAKPTAVPGVQPLNADGQPVAKPVEPKKSPPLTVSARSVQAILLAPSSGPTELETVHCEGRVHVHQNPSPPQEKPIDMRGESLDLIRFPEGYKLSVIGDADRPAEVDLPDLSLLGPKVVIHQVDNVAEVTGPGAMKINSTTDFQGNKLEKPTELLITWRQEMHFNGTLARFQGHVQADQENTRLLCHGMQVTLDRPVRLSQQKPGGNSGSMKAANVEKVVCETTGKQGDPPVSVVDSLRENGLLTRYQRIEAQELAVFKSEGRLEAPGPGEVRIMQKGPKDVQSGPTALPVKKANTPAAPAQQEQKLTWVRYGQKLSVFNEKHLAQFRKTVEVLHLPADNPILHQSFETVVGKLPQRALYLKCEELDVYSQESGPQKFHVLIARNRAEIEVDGWFGQADVITFDESKQQITFQGTPGRPAKVTQANNRGGGQRGSTGEKFIYNRLTGQFKGENVNSITTK